MPLNLRPPGRMPPLDILEISDFRGGLNLVDNWFSIQPTETPDCMDVDFNVNGGVRQRKGIARWSTSQVGTGNVLNMWRFDTQLGSTYAVVNVGENAHQGVGTSWTSLGMSGSMGAGGYMNANDYRGFLWIQRWGAQAATRWSGAALVTLTDPTITGTWQTTFNVPPGIGTNMPRARFITSNNAHTFIGYTVENGTAFPNRVRFSHPGDPGSWRSTDYIDIEAGDGDWIVAMASAKDHVLVFKRNSVWAIYGDSYSNFAVRKVVDRVGTVSQRSVVSADGRIYFFDRTAGLYAYTPRSASSDADSEAAWLGESLFPLLSDRTADQAAFDAELAIGHVDRKIWCTIPGNGTADRTYVYDLRNGSWTRYSLALNGPMLEWDNGTNTVFWLMADRTGRYVYKAEQDTPYDEIVGVNTKIPSYYVTSWVTGGTPTFYKNWKRPELIFTDSSDTVTIRGEVYKDYTSTVVKVMDWELNPPASGGTFWGGSTWGGGSWSGSSTEQFAEIERGSSMGRARAVAFRFSPKNSSELVEWNLAQLTLKLRPRPVRN